ncbi:MAG: hypothetical protein ACLRWH_08500 [Emergencia sp.]
MEEGETVKSGNERTVWAGQYPGIAGTFEQQGMGGKKGMSPYGRLY